MWHRVDASALGDWFHEGDARDVGRPALTLGVGKNLNADGQGRYFLLGSDLFRLLGKLEPSKP